MEETLKGWMDFFGDGDCADVTAADERLLSMRLQRFRYPSRLRKSRRDRTKPIDTAGGVRLVRLPTSSDNAFAARLPR